MILCIHRVKHKRYAYIHDRSLGPDGGTDPKPRVDVGVRAIQTLQQGNRLTLEHDHSIAGVMPEILPAQKMAPDSPVLYYMAAGHKLKHPVDIATLFAPLNCSKTLEILNCELLKNQLFLQSYI
jgi:hypothetical protein